MILHDATGYSAGAFKAPTGQGLRKHGSQPPQHLQARDDRARVCSCAFLEDGTRTIRQSKRMAHAMGILLHPNMQSRRLGGRAENVPLLMCPRLQCTTCTTCTTQLQMLLRHSTASETLRDNSRIQSERPHMQWLRVTPPGPLLGTILGLPRLRRTCNGCARRGRLTRNDDSASQGETLASER